MVLPNILGKEFQCINKIISKLPSSGVGDDCAVIHSGRQKLVISTDSFIEDVHFSLDYFRLEEIGERCAEAAISDIAAMGATPTYMLIASSGRSTKEIEELSKGIKLSLDRHKMKVIGGDTTKSSKLMINITVIGTCKRPIMRNGAKKGDLIYISSHTGLSSAGLHVIQNKIKGYGTLKSAHLRPRAKIQEGIRASKIANAMIDISDGIASELYHIAHSSCCSIEIDNIPIHKELMKLCKRTGKDPLEAALYGGEDYELLYTTTPKNSSKAFGLKIGRVTAKTKTPSVSILKNGSFVELDPTRTFLHF